MRATTLSFAFTLALLGCAPEADDDAPQVDVPTIGDRVAASEFCALHDEIRCAAAMGCCDQSPPFGSQDECLAASTCDAALQPLLDSALVASGALAYDDAAAADYLRAVAAAMSSCGAAPEAAELSTASVMKGTLTEGADCTPVEGDPGSKLACAPGLSCVLSEGGDGATRGTCGREDEAPAGAFGDSCGGDEDCQSSRCVDHACAGTTVNAICQPPEAHTPANAYDYLRTTDVPQTLRVTAHSSTNSGTSDDITLVYRNRSGTYSCTITATIADGGSQECTPTLTSTTTDDSSDKAYVKYTDKTSAAGSDDGLRVTGSAVKLDGTWWEVSWFSDDSSKLYCEGTILAGAMNSCWIDGDGHKDCVEMKYIQSDPASDGADVWCIDTK